MEKTVRMSGFISYAASECCGENYGKMCGEQGFIAVRETMYLVKFIGKGCSIFFSRAYVTLKYSSRIHMVFLPGRTTTEQTYTISGLC